MKLFAVAIVACRRTTNGWEKTMQTQGRTLYLAKDDRDTAEGAALRMAREEWPQKEGWEQHAASLEEIPTEVMQQVLEGAK